MNPRDPTTVGSTAVDEIVRRAVDDGQVPGVVAAIAKSNTTHVAVAGVAEIGGAPRNAQQQTA